MTDEHIVVEIDGAEEVTVKRILGLWGKRIMFFRDAKGNNHHHLSAKRRPLLDRLL